MKSIFEEMGGTYHREGDYLIPDLELPEQEDYQLGKYGRMHQAFLKEHHPVRYSCLLAQGQLWNHLVEIDRSCHQRMEVMITAMKRKLHFSKTPVFSLKGVYGVMNKSGVVDTSPNEYAEKISMSDFEFSQLMHPSVSNSPKNFEYTKLVFFRNNYRMEIIYKSNDKTGFYNEAILYTPKNQAISSTGPLEPCNTYFWSLTCEQIKYSVNLQIFYESQNLLPF